MKFAKLKFVIICSLLAFNAQAQNSAEENSAEMQGSYFFDNGEHSTTMGHSDEVAQAKALVSYKPEACFVVKAGTAIGDIAGFSAESASIETLDAQSFSDNYEYADNLVGKDGVEIDFVYESGLTGASHECPSKANFLDNENETDEQYDNKIETLPSVYAVADNTVFNPNTNTVGPEEIIMDHDTAVSFGYFGSDVANILAEGQELIFPSTENLVRIANESGQEIEVLMCKYELQIGSSPNEIHCFSEDPRNILEE